MDQGTAGPMQADAQQAKKTRKRTRTEALALADKLHISAKSTDKPEKAYWTTMSLSKPDDGEECPISQESISTYDLEFLAGCTFRPDHPDYRKMTLECGHGFSAMALTYHFFKNGMQCPMCRKGDPRTMDPLCVPQHFRKEMQTRVALEEAQVRPSDVHVYACLG